MVDAMAEEDDLLEVAESNMSDVDADMKSTGNTRVNTDMTDSSSVRSLLKSLRSPTPSVLAQKRRLRTNPPSVVK